MTCVYRTASLMTAIFVILSPDSALVLADEPPTTRCPEAAALQVSQLRLKTVEELIHLLDMECISELNQRENPRGLMPQVQEELVRRAPVRELLGKFERSCCGWWQPYTFDVLKQIGGDKVDHGLKRLASRRPDQTSMLAVEYFAERGEKWALAILNDNFLSYPLSSMERAEIASLFGRQRYEPAAESLAQVLEAASLNLSGAAVESLIKIYPDGCGIMGSPHEAKECWVPFVAQRRSKSAP